MGEMTGMSDALNGIIKRAELANPPEEGDMIILTLNDPEVMGKDTFGYDRLKKVLDALGKNYDKYFDALTKGPEADYAREKMDAAMRRIVGGKGPFFPFEQRYEWLPEITYGKKR